MNNSRYSNPLKAKTSRNPAARKPAALADTPQRRVIMKVLAESHDHPTAEVLHARVREHLPRVSLATVYRNLKLFVTSGLIDEVATGNSYARYDANRTPHHHLVCKLCGEVADYYSTDLDALGSPGADLDGFEVHDLKVNLFGLCRACRQAPAEPGAEGPTDSTDSTDTVSNG